MNTDIFMSKEEIVETLKDFVFGNFEIPMKVRTAINEAVCMFEAKDKTIDRVLQIIDQIDEGLISHTDELREAIEELRQ